MKVTIVGLGLASLCVRVGASAQEARTVVAPLPIASIMTKQLGFVEQQFVPAAEAMPAEKYSFAPTSGNFAGVRTFAQEVKHVATINYVFSSALLGEAPPPGVTDNSEMNGPDTIRTKEQIVAYLKASFAFARHAMSTLTADNADLLLDQSSMQRAGVPSFLNTRLALASFTCTHAFDHYGQVVEYLRMNGLIPPASRGQAAANPAG